MFLLFQSKFQMESNRYSGSSFLICPRLAIPWRCLVLLAGRGKELRFGEVQPCGIWHLDAFGRFMVTVPQGLSEGHTFQARAAVS